MYLEIPHQFISNSLIRILSIYESGTTLPSLSIVVQTPEDIPDGPVQNVTVSRISKLKIWTDL